MAGKKKTTKETKSCKKTTSKSSKTDESGEKTTNNNDSNNEALQNCNEEFDVKVTTSENYELLEPPTVLNINHTQEDNSITVEKLLSENNNTNDHSSIVERLLSGNFDSNGDQDQVIDLSVPVNRDRDLLPLQAVYLDNGVSEENLQQSQSCDPLALAIQKSVFVNLEPTNPVQTDLMILNSGVNSVIENNSDYVVEYLTPPTRGNEERINKKRKILESLCNIEENTTRLKKIKVDNEVLDLDCEWEECSVNLDSWSKFMEHVRKHISDTQIRPAEKENDEDVFVCLWEECGFECMASDEMVRHINYHSFHTKVKCQGLNMVKLQGLRGCSLDTNQRNIFQDLTDPFKCKWFGCPEFDKNYEHPQYFYWHVASHADEATEFDCNWDDCCKKNFASKTRLREHLRSHSQEKQFACPTCGALFATKIKFFDHLKRQQDTDASFICSNCNKAFALERLLRDHMRSHINTYECKECGMFWPTPSALKTHFAYRHSDERLVPCEDCDYKAKSHHDLKVHARSHQGEVLPCMEGCGFVCKSNQVMKNHFLKVHLKNSRKYACHLCEAVYGRGALLTDHLKKKHKITSTTSRFRYSLDEATGMYRVQLYRFELQDEEKDGGNLEIDTEVESVYQASPAPSSMYQASPAPSSTNYQPSPAPSSTNYHPSPAPTPTPSSFHQPSSAHYPSPIPHPGGGENSDIASVGGGMPILAVRSGHGKTSSNQPGGHSDWSSQEGGGTSVYSEFSSSMRSSMHSQFSESVRSSVHSTVEAITIQSYQELGYTFPFGTKISEEFDVEQVSRKFRCSTPGIEIDVTKDEFS